MKTVGQLIEELKKYDPGLIVSVTGYEEGVTDIFFLDVYKVLINKNTGWVYGEHEPIPEHADTNGEETGYRLVIDRKDSPYQNQEGADYLE